jgi:ATP-dependent RNA helicase DDX10/DBP4
VGRTARYEKEGKGVLFLDPSEEEGMLKRLEHKKVPIQQTKPRQKKQQSVKNQLQNMCFQDPELRYLGQKSFVSYTKSLFVQKDKEIFQVQKYDLEGYATSLGLPGAPKIKFMKGDDAKRVKNAARGALSSDDESGDEAIPKKPKKEEVRTKYDRMFERRNQNVLSEHYAKMVAGGDVDEANDEADEDADFLSVKRTIAVEDLPSEDEDAAAASGPQAKLIEGVGKEPILIDSKRKEKLLKSKKQLVKLKEKGTKLVYDEEGNPHQLYELEDETDFQRRGTAAEQRAKFVEEEAARVREADLGDKELAKQKKREKKEKRKARELAEQNGFVSDDDDQDEAPHLVHGDDDAQDPLDFLASLPTAGDDSDEHEGERDRPKKRPKKWFEDDSDEERKQKKRKSRIIEAEDEPETLEDLEALAAGLLR